MGTDGASIFFVVAVFLWFIRAIIRINMPQEATRTPHMVPWGWGEGRKKYFSISLISPTHRRTEGRAPVWGSKFTSKDAALQGGIHQKPLLG